MQPVLLFVKARSLARSHARFLWNSTALSFGGKTLSFPLPLPGKIETLSDALSVRLSLTDFICRLCLTLMGPGEDWGGVGGEIFILGCFIACAVRQWKLLIFKQLLFNILGTGVENNSWSLFEVDAPHLKVI